MSDVSLESLAATLEASGDFRVLRRLKPRDEFTPLQGAEHFSAILLDVETTGLDAKADEIIELGMIRFDYGRQGEVFRVTGRFNALSEPSQPLPQEIIDLTGLTDEMLAGQSIDDAAVAEFVKGARLVIAHNARFDRPFAERRFPLFSQFNWGCSLMEIPWRAEGMDGGKLGYLLNSQHLFHTGHRALDDCEALLYLLAQPLPQTKRPALGVLLDNARVPTLRIFALNTAFELKDILKKRGYRWNDGTDGAPKAWYVDIREDALTAEEDFLATEIYIRRDVDTLIRRITARDRYSGR